MSLLKIVLFCLCVSGHYVPRLTPGLTGVKNLPFVGEGSVVYPFPLIQTIFFSGTCLEGQRGWSPV